MIHYLPKKRQISPVKIIQHYQKGLFKLPLGRTEIKAVLEAMLEALPGPKIGELELCLVDDAAQSHFNAVYLGCFGPTNIISFPAVNGPACLSLSIDSFERESQFYGQDKVRYLLFLLAHGMGHIAGFEHGTEMDAASELCFRAALGVVQRMD